ncbi:hypothetical protein HRbin36_02275 [bacterium HR36]|nr:hypothetical protein HRbin36_02275 [bacterium HR36]
MRHVGHFAANAVQASPAIIALARVVPGVNALHGLAKWQPAWWVLHCSRYTSQAQKQATVPKCLLSLALDQSCRGLTSMCARMV